MLEYAVPAMRTLFLSEVEPRVPPEDWFACAEMYTRAWVELAHLRHHKDGSELGVFDEDRISDIAELCGVDRSSIDFIWFIAKNEVEDGEVVRRQAAHKKLDEDNHAAVAHKPLVDLAEAARLFRRNRGRDKALFAKRPGRACIHTGMPMAQFEGFDYVMDRGVPDGPGGGRFTRAERKALCAELGVKADTLRKAERDKTPEEFEAWAAKVRKAAATKARKAAEREARANRRKRKPGRTAAVRQFALRSGYSLSHSWRLLDGLTTAQIKARTAPSDLVCIGGYGGVTGEPTPPDESDKNGSHPAFSSATETRDTATVHSHHESDSDSDKNGSHPAKFHSFTPDHISCDDTITAPAATPVDTSHVTLTDVDPTETLTASDAPPATDTGVTLDAWAKLRTIPNREVDLDGLRRESAWHTYLDCTRASTVYGSRLLPNEHQHTDALIALFQGADDAGSEWLDLDPRWQAAFEDDDREAAFRRRAA